MQTDEKKILAKELAKTVQQFKRYALNKSDCQELRQSEFILLSTINHYVGAEDRGVKVSDLSTQMEITPAAVTHLINSVEDAGLLERHPDSSDRRIVLVKLTEKGKLLCEEKEERILQSFQGLVEFIGEKDSRELKRLLTAMYTYLKERKK